MGYDVHITRAQEWFESERAPITLEEWLACVREDPELRLEHAVRASTADGDALEVELPGLAAWTAWSRHAEPDAVVHLWHSDGCIDCRGIDDEVTAKLYRIAQSLGARVVGDDGEEYGPDGAALVEEPPDPPAKQRWWRRLFGGADQPDSAADGSSRRS